MRLTWFGANSWLIQLGQQHLLVDSWLVGSLVFKFRSQLANNNLRTQVIDPQPGEPVELNRV